jgi:(p)ppGpp synthase/HD superfamily hydrolase
MEIAVSAHKRQVDKAGAPYIMHPLRVMMSLSTEAERIVGILHDVVEDSDWTFELLEEEGFEDQILVALASVTAISGESYDDFIVRASSNPIGRQVKIADLKYNMDMKRISDPTDCDFERLKQYSRSLAYLQDENASKFSA